MKPEDIINAETYEEYEGRKARENFIKDYLEVFNLSNPSVFIREKPKKKWWEFWK